MSAFIEDSLVPTTLSFYQHIVDISQPSNFQIHIQFGDRVPAVLRALSSLKVEFSGQMSWIISHRPSSENEISAKLRTKNLGLIHMQRQGELHADLNFIKDGTLVLSGEVVSDTAINLRVRLFFVRITSLTPHDKPGLTYNLYH